MKKTIQLLFIGLLFSVTMFAQADQNVKIDELTTATFKQKVWNYDTNKAFDRIGKLPIILDFHATWCRPCKMLAPHLQAIQNKYNDKLIIYKIDVDKEPELARLFKIEAMPTIVFVNSKTTYTSELGYKSFEEFEALVKERFFSKK
jgi:thioredoxin